MHRLPKQTARIILGALTVALIASCESETEPVVDTTPPGVVTDLSIGSKTSSSITVQWTAPGDDGDVGTARFYDLRVSSSPITASNFSAAHEVVGEPIPLSAGSAQFFSVPGLTENSIFYFAMKTIDEVPNTSGLSNLATGSTLASQGGDGTPPNPIIDLVTTTRTASTITVAWTAPGDDGTVGTASSYDIRYSTSSISAGNFSSASQVSNEPQPALAGTSQSMEISGLVANTSYFFAMKTSDEVPNVSTISNIATGQTALPGGDITPPGAVTDLKVRGPDQNSESSVALSWSAPGDDGVNGIASSYEIRYSTAPITAANFSSALLAGQIVPPPFAAGTLQYALILGLSPHTAYYFALRSVDEALNVSPISNIVTATTLFAPPRQVQGLESNGSADGQVLGPFAVALDLNDSLYVADTGNHRVEKFSRGLAFLRKWGTPGLSANQFRNPWAITSGMDGFVYVADSTGRVQQFTERGEFRAQWQTGFIGVNKRILDIAANAGHVYVTEGTYVYSYTPDGTPEGRYPSENRVFDVPWYVKGLALDANGNLLVAGSTSVEQLDVNLTLLGYLRRGGAADIAYDEIYTIGDDKDGNVYVVAKKLPDDIFLEKLSPSGEIIYRMPLTASLFFQFAVDRHDGIYIPYPGYGVLKYAP